MTRGLFPLYAARTAPIKFADLEKNYAGKRDWRPLPRLPVGNSSSEVCRRSFFLHFLAGAVYLVAGFFLVQNPPEAGIGSAFLLSAPGNAHLKAATYPRPLGHQPVCRDRGASQ